MPIFEYNREHCNYNFDRLVFWVSESNPNEAEYLPILYLGTKSTKICSLRKIRLVRPNLQIISKMGGHYILCFALFEISCVLDSENIIGADLYINYCMCSE